MGQSEGRINLNDRSVRWLMAPLLGVAIGLSSGLLSQVSPLSAKYYLGLLWFAGVSVVVWYGNLILWQHARRRTDWLRAPRRRALVLTFNSVPYSFGVATGLLWLWYRVAGILPVDWRAIFAGAGLSMVAAAMIVNIYETVLLIRERAYDRLAMEHLERAKLQAELTTQLDPHFLFNSLHTLAGLNEEDPPRAADYTVLLADLYRYILDHRRQDLVPLAEELEFLRDYFRLLQLRFEDRIALTCMVDPGEAGKWQVPPVSLQLLLENAVKHNRSSASDPLNVEVSLDAAQGGWVVVRNRMRPPDHPPVGTQTGLRNLDERCRLSLGRHIDVRRPPGYFVVRVPLKA